MSKQPVRYITIDSESAGQRLDNFLFRTLKGVPKTHIYKLLRKGEIRINKKRVGADYRIQAEDQLRLAPMNQGEAAHPHKPSEALFSLLKQRIIYEDADLLIMNKPIGISVHGGTQVAIGVIEALRYYLPDYKFVELAHRLDRDTSGCLIMAKRRSILNELHGIIREGKLQKTYLALVLGHWEKNKRVVDAPLLKNHLSSGERVVKVCAEGKASYTEFKPLEYFESSSLVEVTPHTGRTHQIRVHTTHAGHPIAGDEKYGDRAFNRLMREYGLKRLFLHAAAVSFELPKSRKSISVKADLDNELLEVMKKLRLKK